MTRPPFRPGEPVEPARHSPAGQGRPEPPPPPRAPDPWAAPLLAPIAVGCAVAVLLGVYGDLHQPTGFSINLAGFSSGQYVKAWLTTTAVILGIVQMISASVMYGKIRIGSASGWAATLHRWSGRLAVLFTVPVVVHCVYALGFQVDSPRVLVHSVLGCAFYGAFVTKMLALTKRGLPSWAVPVIGAVVFSTLIGVSLTSALWLFSAQGLHF